MDCSGAMASFTFNLTFLVCMCVFVCVCVCVCMDVPHATYVEVRGHLGGVCFLLPPLCGSRSGSQSKLLHPLSSLAGPSIHDFGWVCVVSMTQTTVRKLILPFGFIGQPTIQVVPLAFRKVLTIHFFP